ncbi:hypothetical protein J4050_00890 [Winogradskyella sp. DF17]|uniref:Lipocalin-like domain-containing protein n=1 Tax=Winogradskyella pelagia TaxID=2819984 RepID=A0ABS3SXR0_9FLAO|nr:hypothetical protein [Winogradskyella sp. DF17]MBO3115281.1 hypothetical protein [Winogradskyella sp. DF17]
MKRVVALFSLFALLTAFTCENEPLDDDIIIDNGGEINTDILGVWNLVEFDVETSTTTNFNGTEVSSDVQIFSTSADYTVNFTESTFTTNGGYSYSSLVIVNGMEIPNDPVTLTNVSGNGTYGVSGNEMTVNGQFFEFSLDGVDSSVFGEDQTLQFQISEDGQTLTFLQNETQIASDPTTGAETTSVIEGFSVWTRDFIDDTCTAEAATNAAAEAFNEDSTNEDLCNAYRQALLDQIEECGDDGSLQAILNDLSDCAAVTSSGELRVRAGTLTIEFVQQTVSFDGGIITVEGISAQGGYEIYFQVAEGDTGTDVFQNFVLTLNGTEFFPSTQGFEDFTSDTTISSGNILQATFFGIVESEEGADLSLTQGLADLTY